VSDTRLYRDLAAFGLGLVDQHGWDLFSLTVDLSETWNKYDKANPADYHAIACGRVVLQLRDDYTTVRPIVLDMAPGASCDDRTTYVNLTFHTDLGRDLPVSVEVCANTRGYL
jgi:hypothetical protein